MAVTLGSAYGKISIDTKGVKTGVDAAKKSVSDFQKSLSAGQATMKNFNATLLDAAGKAGLNERQIIKMAGATGQYSDKQLLAARSTSAVAAKADELTRAVAAGQMTTREAGRAFAEFAKQQEVLQDNSSKSIFSMKNLAIAFGVVTAAVAAGKQVMDWSQEGAQFKRLEQAGHDLARSMGADMDEIVGKIKSASLNTVSTADTIAAANRAMMLGLGSDADTLANLMQVAALRGRAMGISTTQAFGDIVTGIGRMSPLILDNLGIVVDAEARYRKWADATGKSTDQLDAATKKQILLNAVLEEGNRMLADHGGLVDDDAARYEQLTAALDDYWVTLQLTLAGMSKGAGGFGEFLRTVINLREAVDNGNMSWYEAAYLFNRMAFTGKAAAEVQNEITTAVTGRTEAERAGLRMMAVAQDRERQRAAAANAAADATGKHTANLRAQRAAIEAAYGPGQRFKNSLYEQAEAAKYAADETERLRTRTDGLKLLQAALAAGLAGQLQSAYDSYLETTQSLTVEQGDLNQELEKALKQGYSPTSQKVKDLNAALEENAGKQREAAQAMSEATAQMIYQQASAGLDTQASLDLARAMGLISEKDYAVAASVEALRQAYDKNRDGAITASEKAGDFADDVANVNTVVDNLVKAGLPVTMENIAAGLTAINEENKLTEVLEPLDLIKTSAGELAEEKIPAMQTASGEAATTMQSDFSETNTNIEATKTKLGEVKTAIEALPDGKTVTITVKTVQTGGGGGTGTTVSIPPNIPEFASGGAYMAHQPFIAGEQGAEIIWPATAGRVFSNLQSANMLAAGGSTQYTHEEHTYLVGDHTAASTLRAMQTSARIGKLSQKWGRR